MKKKNPKIRRKRQKIKIKDVKKSPKNFFVSIRMITTWNGDTEFQKIIEVVSKSKLDFGTDGCGSRDRNPDMYSRLRERLRDDLISPGIGTIPGFPSSIRPTMTVLGSHSLRPLPPRAS